MEIGSGKQSLPGNTHHRVLRLNTEMLNTDYDDYTDTQETNKDIEQENFFYYFCMYTKLELLFTGFPWPYKGF